MSAMLKSGMPNPLLPSAIGAIAIAPAVKSLPVVETSKSWSVPIFIPALACSVHIQILTSVPV